MPTADLLNTLVQYAQIVSPLAIVVSAFIYSNQKRKDRKEKAIQIGIEIENLISMIDYVNLMSLASAAAAGSSRSVAGARDYTTENVAGCRKIPRAFARGILVPIRAEPYLSFSIRKQP